MSNHLENSATPSDALKMLHHVIWCSPSLFAQLCLDLNKWRDTGVLPPGPFRELAEELEKFPDLAHEAHQVVEHAVSMLAARALPSTLRVKVRLTDLLGRIREGSEAAPWVVAEIEKILEGKS